MRQCDGHNIRALVVIRDGSWMGVTEFLRLLELPLQEGRNIGPVELLSRAEARQVLEVIGRESGALPIGQGDGSDDVEVSGTVLSATEKDFIATAVDQLAIGDSVICLHLVMFSQMARFQSWDPDELKQNGGVSGACSLFFQELFHPGESSSKQSPEYKRVGPAVLPIMRELLPRDGENVMTRSLSEKELVAAAKQSKSEGLVADALRVLTDDLGVVARFKLDDRPSDHAYRLSHDFLVEPIRVWTTRSRYQTVRGWAADRLADGALAWHQRPTSSQMPGYLRYLMFLAMSPMISVSPSQKRYLAAATRHHAGRIGITVLSILAFFAVTTWAFYQHSQAQQSRQAELATKVDLLFHGPAKDISKQIESLEKFGSLATDAMGPWANSVDEQARLRANLFLQFQNPDSFAPLVATLENAPDEYFGPLLDLAKRTPDAAKILRAIKPDCSPKSTRAAIMLAYLGDTSSVEAFMVGSESAVLDTAFLKMATSWRGDAKPWSDLVSSHTDPQVRYHAGVILGSYPKQSLTKVKLGLNAMLNDRSITIHSMGKYLGMHLGVDLSDVPFEPPANANWQVGPRGITMAQIKGKPFSYYEVYSSGQQAPKPEVMKMSGDIWFSTVPVTRGLYNEFLADSGPLANGKETKSDVLTHKKRPFELQNDESQPILGIDLDHAVSFCNWFSVKEKLQPCYRYLPTTHAEVVADLYSLPEVPWETVSTASGYRLPTWDEFSTAARTGYRFGVPWGHVASVGISGGDYIPAETDDYARRLFSIVPNRWGLNTNDRCCGSHVMDRFFPIARIGNTSLFKNPPRNRATYTESIYLVQDIAPNEKKSEPPVQEETDAPQ